MYSKPKGLYVKQRDRPVRRLTPRSSEEYELGSPRSDPDGRNSPEVHVENFGDGQINAGVEPLWPRKDFERDDSIEGWVSSEPRPGTSTATGKFPIRAQQYMVENNSYQDLTRTKYITVPEPNIPKGTTIEKPVTRRSVHNSVRSFTQVVDDPDFPLVSTQPEKQEKPAARVTGTNLTRTKYITVPEPKGTTREKPATKKSIHGSAGSLTQVVDDPDFPLVSTQPTHAKPVPRVTGTHRGHPNKAVSRASARHSHIATIRINPKHHTLKGVRGHMATVKAIPRDGAVHTVKGYHFGHNATVRAHNTGHAVKHLKHALSSWDKPDGTFKRNTYAGDRKEYFINQFAIELDRSDSESYSPGDVLSGRIILEALSNIEIRFVELLIVGLVSVHFGKQNPQGEKNSQEVLVSKRSYVMGTPDGRWNSVVTAGKYVSRFKFKLPDNLPSTITYENKENGFAFEVGYLVKARICDDMGSSSLRSTHSTNNYVKVLLTRRFPFMVRSSFDINAMPKALEPVNHSELINVNCIPVFTDSAAITLSLDRSVFLAGDEIRVKLITSSSTARKIKSLTCDLQQRVLSSVRPRQTFTVVQIYEDEPQGLQVKQKSQSLVLFEFVIPTHSNFIPSYLTGVKMIKVSYTIMMTIKFKTCSGKLFLECPIGIGPSADPLNLNQTNAVPVFNRPIRFPHFSRDSQVTAKTQNGTAHSGGNTKQVKSVYKTNSSQLLCCCIDENDL
ncbi:uncharacterized protein LOC123546897 [Mercenaria mercenaria]|uniref:uncharacterized protein LOC123546897 n=1 Tax=Mercenaria mercenaria TaxID=6596 RepID=UPI00234F382E|nr:uncharacterized protein LOC123546897 [Mercenaria mercenaria]XP_045189471.2 uncharacterized protein LOC123546897 [Mercenaria mercenaria]XP_045189472.2 uncharacterized protein LOC123546897 [Mercenaria mercenaria]XP_045189474.2 uncharacterized protein LOC123546897 [Mercenaria mercenaria]XP_045189476.2 uncharacterized protein LOC123546897 [Mercenaria mercenaria]